MTRTQLESLARGLSPVVKELVQQTLLPLIAELDRLKGENASLVTQVSGLSLKVNAFETIQKSVHIAAPLDTAVVERLVALEVNKAVSAIRVPEDGKSVTAEDVQPIVAAEVSKAMAEIPVPKDGAPGPAGEIGPAGPSGIDGRDGRDGQSVSMEDVEGLVSRAIEALPKAKDGIGLAGALIDREGQLVVTLTDGTSKTLGLVVGKDVDPSEVQRFIVEEVAKIPRPKDGEKGIDGRDGTLENIKLAQIDDRTWQWQFKDGTPVEGGSIRVPTLIFRDYWDAEKSYETGDVVMRDGSSWLAIADNVKSQPGTNLGAAAWRLIAKRGRDGREGKQGLIGPAGPRGEKGTDGRHAYS